MQAPTYHTPVLLREVLAHLLTSPEGVYVDGTLGGAGHASAVAERLSGAGRLIGIDRDDDALAEARGRLERFGARVDIRRGAFADMPQLLSDVGPVDGILLDLGVSSHQLDAQQRGFSFRGDERLDMRMDRRQSVSAYDVVNGYDEADLTRILFDYGEERHARTIARRLLRARPVVTTGALAEVVSGGVRGPQSVKTLARVFQALRIEVNGELDQLQRFLKSVPALLRNGGRVVVIAYHSLEDRAVKESFRAAAADRIASGSRFLPDEPRNAELRLLTRRPVTADDEEQRVNPRSRSAKLRAAERI